jgi:hypothetical protein
MNSMDNAAHDSDPRGTTPRRRWWQFSLLNLLLVAVIVCVVAAFLRSKQELSDERRAMQIERGKHQARLGEIKKLQDRLGNLTVADKSKVYIKARPQNTEMRFQWRWRIYLPQGPEKWNFVLSVGEIKKDGFEVQRPVYISGRPGGQVDAEFSIERGLEGSLRTNLAVRGDDYSTERHGVILEEDLQSLLRSVRTKGISQGGLKLQAEPADGPVELLRVVSTNTPQVETGLLFFLERSTPWMKP